MVPPPNVEPAAFEAAMVARRALSDSPMQRRLREEKRSFVAVVYWQPGDYDAAVLRREFARIRETGFSAVRFHTQYPEETAPGVYDFSRRDEWMDLAAEAGLGVIYHHEHPKPSDAMLRKHGITRECYNASNLDDDPAMLAPLEEALRPIIERYRKHPALYMWVLFGEPGGGGRPFTEPDKIAFGTWLRERHGSIESLDRAWNLYPQAGRPMAGSFEEAWRVVGDITQESGISTVALAARQYGPARDLMRWQTELTLRRARAAIAIARRYDTDHPISVGSHQLLLNQAMLRWDTGQWARMADQHFSSIHLSWHFEQVRGEVDRPVYMQARLTRDLFKEGWTSAFETTGGAVQYSGGYGNSMSAGLMRRLMLSYLAAGNQSIAFWSWNARPGGVEGGEYGLTTLSGAVSAWAREAGAVARALEKYRGELWEPDHQPRVGLLHNWDNDAILMLEPERHDLQGDPSAFTRGTRAQGWRSLIGAARALTNQKVGFEFVTADEIMAGIAACYPAIYVPHMRAASAELVEKLGEYVRQGGRLIADVQFAFCDPWGKLHRTGPGGLLERTFGAWFETIHDARTQPRVVNGLAVDGFCGDIASSGARPVARFGDGTPAVTELLAGRGRAMLVGFDLARMCFEPGNAGAESLLATLADDAAPAWRCDAPLAFRLAHPAADHYFLLNDGAARSVTIRAFDRPAYTGGVDAITGEAVDVRGTIAVELAERSAAWIRLERPRVAPNSAAE